jgi:hypothetical protein
MSENIPVTVEGHGVWVTVRLADGEHSARVVKVSRTAVEAGDWAVSPVGSTLRIDRVTHFKNHTRLKFDGGRTFNHDADTILIVPSFE